MKQVEVTIDELMALKQENAAAADAHAKEKEMVKRLLKDKTDEIERLS